MWSSALLPILAVLSGFVALIWSADRFVAGSANTAYNLGVSPLVIGLTIVGLGTSAPEIIVAAMSALEGNPGLAVGNAIGSNIANIALILAVTAIIIPLTVKPGLTTRELPLLLLVTGLGVILLWDQRLDRLDGVILLTALVLVMTWIVRHALNQPRELVEREIEIETDFRRTTPRALLLVAVGLLALIASSRILVWGAVELAQLFGVSDLVIGLTIIAIGTSLPELATSIAAALKNQHELMLGNIIGSNIFNLLAVLAVPGLILPSAVDADVIHRDVPVMVVLTLALFVSAFSFGKHLGRISRLEGLLLLIAYVAYMVYLYHSPGGVVRPVV